MDYLYLCRNDSGGMEVTMKRITSILVCFSLILSLSWSGIVFAIPEIPDSNPGVSPGDDWSLIKIIDFERDGGFVLGNKASGTTGSYFREDADTPTGWYLEHSGPTNSLTFSDSVPDFPILNHDAVSVKFKLWASDDWGNNGHVAISMGPTNITVISKDASSNRGAFVATDHSSGWPSTPYPFKDAEGNNIVYRDGWNDIEIRLFKDTPGADENYTRAEYYFNGVQGTANKPSTLNERKPLMADTADYPLDVRCGNVQCTSRFDEVYIYGRTTDELTKLDNPVVNLYDGKILGFTGTDYNVKSYIVRIYKEGKLASTVTKIPGESMYVDFSSLVDGAELCEYSVQLKGDYVTTKNSDEVFFTGTEELAMPEEAPSKLAVPPEWQNGTVLTWDTLDAAHYYEVKLYKEDNEYEPVHIICGVAETSIDLNEYMFESRSGNYTATVAGVNYVGVGDSSDISDSVYYYDGLPTEVPAQLSEPPVWSDNTPVLTWDSLAETDYYVVKLYKIPDTTTPLITVTDVNETTCDLYRYMLLNGDGNYTATVEGVNIVGNGEASSPSAEFAYDIENYRNTEFLCNFEAPAYIVDTNLSNTASHSAIVCAEAEGSNGQYLKLEHIGGNMDYSFDLPEENADVVSVKFRIYLNSDEIVNVNAESSEGIITTIPFTNVLCQSGQWYNAEIRMIKEVLGANKPYTRAEYYIDGNLIEESSVAGTHKTIKMVSFSNPVGTDNAVYIDEISLDNFFEDAEEDENKVDDVIESMNVPKIVSSDKINLPFSDNAAINIVWSSVPSGIISNNGDIIHPSYSGGGATPFTPVTLTATVEKGSVLKTKDFTVNVLHNSVLGNLAKNADRRWLSANSVFALDLREEKTFNSVVLNDLSSNVRKIALKYGNDLAETDKFVSFYVSDEEIENIIILPNHITARYIMLEVIECGSGSATLDAMEIYNFQSYEEILENAADAINLGKISKITDDIKLPTKGLSGTTISWSSDNPRVISDSGVVNRPTDSNVTVELTATVSIEGTELTKSVVFSATVLPKSQSGGGSSGSSGSLHSGTGGGVSANASIAVPVPTLQNNFTDIKGHWAEMYINKLKDRGIVKGNPDGNFYPESQITRAEILAMVIRALNISESKYDGQFKDVSDNDWYSGVVQSALDAELISKDTLFRPNDSITREEIAKIVVQSMRQKGHNISNGDTLAYTDTDIISGWAVEYVREATYLGLMSGMGDGSFAPKGIATRAQAAAVIERLLTLISN